MAVYIYALSSYEDVILTDNRNADYLNTVVVRIESSSNEYRNVYSKAYTYLEEYVKGSGEQWLLKGLGIATKGLGEGINKIPVINNLQVDEKLVDVGNNLVEINQDFNENQLKKLLNKQKVAIRPFVENIELMKHMYNDEIKIGFDGDNIYLA